jgi:hypothetical protein
MTPRPLRRVTTAARRYEASREARDAAIREAVASGRFSYREVGDAAGLTKQRIARLAKEGE